MTTAEEFKAVLALQNEVDQKLDELIARIAAIKKANKDRRIIATIDGELYELDRADTTMQTVDKCRKYDGFFSEYRLIKLPKPIQ